MEFPSSLYPGQINSVLLILPSSHQEDRGRSVYSPALFHKHVLMNDIKHPQILLSAVCT
uniref:Uncharacterized protein n=1 Tax=Anguilla anguilla TaxID=7936 RepID=A0A0E9PND5_ANGAN